MNDPAPSYSKTRLASDQAAGAISLTPRRRRIVFLVVGLLVAAGVALGVWSAVSHDQYGPSGNGCVNLTIASSTGGQPIHDCGAAAKSFCKTAFANSDRISLLARPQCDLAGWTKAKVAAG
ncbi:MAG TPA: hypothetical protein VH021_03840 [Trebonia sp.]|jgi:hypothetical protein|nr:hypothetical protein [Trebonia sp.]